MNLALQPIEPGALERRRPRAQLHLVRSCSSRGLEYLNIAGNISTSIAGLYPTRLQRSRTAVFSTFERRARTSRICRGILCLAFLLVGASSARAAEPNTFTLVDSYGRYITVSAESLAGILAQVQFPRGTLPVNIVGLNGAAPSAGNPFPVTCVAGCAAGGAFVDNSVFTVGTSNITPIGGYYTSGADPACTSGNDCRIRIDSHSYLFVDCAVGCAGGSFNNNADAVATSATNGQSAAWLYGYNGATWDRLRSSIANGLQVDVTRVQGTVTVSGTAAVTQTTSPWVVSCTAANCAINVSQWAGSALGAMANYGTSPGAVLVPGVNAFITNTVAVTLTSTTITGTVAVTQSTSPWVVSCTAANCAINLSQVAGVNLGATAVTNFGTAPAAAAVPGVNASLFAGTTALAQSGGNLGIDIERVLGAAISKTNPAFFNIADGTNQLTAALSAWGTAPTGTFVMGVNADQFISGVIQGNDGTAGFAGVGGHFADNGVAAATNRIPTLAGIYQTSYLNGTAATLGRNGALSVGTDGLLWTAQLPAIRPASYHWSGSFAGSSTTFAAHLAGNASDTLLVTKVTFSCTQTTAGNVTVTVNKTSAASTGGTAATLTAVPDDSNYGAAASVGQSFTGTGPTVGTLVGQIDAYKLGCMATGTATPNDIYILNLRQKPVVLRGTAQTLEIGVGAATTGGNYTVTFEGIETATITP